MKIGQNLSKVCPRQCGTFFDTL